MMKKKTQHFLVVGLLLSESESVTESVTSFFNLQVVRSSFSRITAACNKESPEDIRALGWHTE